MSAAAGVIRARVHGAYAPLLATVMTLMASCAVLTVDVDVYKGPLANHEQVQSEQLAVLAIGAKPLLIGLRDLLEQRARGGASIRGQSWYDAFIRDDPDGKSRLRSVDAARVNEILGLYEDALEDPFRAPIDEVLRLRGKIEVAVADFRARPPASAAGHWNQLSRGVLPAEEFLRSWVQDPGKVKDREEVLADIAALADARMKLVAAYAEALGGDDPAKGLREIGEAHGELLQPLCRKARLVFPAGRSFHGTLGPGSPGGLSEIVNALTHDDFVAAHARFLFGAGDEARPAREAFVAEVSRIANAYLDVRLDVRALYRCVLQTIAYTVKPLDPAQAARFHALGEQAADVVVTLTKATSLWAAWVAIDDATLRVSPERRAVRKRLAGFAASFRAQLEAMGGARADFDPGQSESITAIQEALGQLFESDPVGTAKALLDLDDDFAREDFDEYVEPMRERLGSRTVQGRAFDRAARTSWQRWFGLTFGSAGVADIAVLDEAVFHAFFRSGGLGGGRLPLGLESVIEEYVATSYRLVGTDSPEVEKTRARMVTQLVQFAEKVLVIANNQMLLESGAAQATPLPPDPDGPGARAPTRSGAGIEREQDQYIRVLQAIGNSILVQADELTHRDAHARALAARAPLEAEAARAAFQPTVGEILGRLLSWLEREQSALAEDAAPRQAAGTAALQIVRERLQKITGAAALAAGTPALAVDPIVVELLKRGAAKAPAPVKEAYAALGAEIRAWADAFFVLPALSGADDPRQTVDALIAALRYRIARLEGEPASPGAGGANGEIERLRRAIRSLEQQRAALIYIRPSSAYLRTSYPATTLQDDATSSGSNLVLHQGLRSIPILAQLVELFSVEARRRAELAAEIDKQFWQNINRVRVAGAGNTNYVIAKDDIGNWYIKSYSADPKPMIDAMKSLARFTMGGGVPASLPGGTTKTGAAGASGVAPGGGNPANAAPEKQEPDLTTLVRERRQKFVAAGRTQATGLKELLTIGSTVETSLLPRLKVLWQEAGVDAGGVTALATAVTADGGRKGSEWLDHAVKRFPAALDEADETTVRAALDGALDDLASAADELHGIVERTLSTAANDSVRVTAAAATRRFVRNVALEQIAARRETLASLTGGIDALDGLRKAAAD